MTVLAGAAKGVATACFTNASFFFLEAGNRRRASIDKERITQGGARHKGRGTKTKRKSRAKTNEWKSKASQDLGTKRNYKKTHREASTCSRRRESMIRHARNVTNSWGIRDSNKKANSKIIPATTAINRRLKKHMKRRTAIARNQRPRIKRISPSSCQEICRFKRRRSRAANSCQEDTHHSLQRTLWILNGLMDARPPWPSG